MNALRDTLLLSGVALCLTVSITCFLSLAMF